MTISLCSCVFHCLQKCRALNRTSKTTSHIHQKADKCERVGHTAKYTRCHLAYSQRSGILQHCYTHCCYFNSLVCNFSPIFGNFMEIWSFLFTKKGAFYVFFYNLYEKNILTIFGLGLRHFVMWQHLQISLNRIHKKWK